MENMPSKDEVGEWESVAYFVATFPDGDGEGACDVSVEIGESDGVWFVRTRDDAGGEDDADDSAYETRDEAVAAAEEFAEEHDESDGASDAESYLLAAAEAQAGEPDPDGAWCVYWETALDDFGPRSRYATQEQAEAAAEIANADLRAANPGGNLLCGFSVRALVDGEWTDIEAQ